ncbi:MAG: nucleotide sugar dehydrogenase [Phycisphaerae bacterium]|nr:nucleotide sugar dehydrogenase [Phycisphaerae bacterium]
MSKITSGNAKVGVIGLGYVGLPLAAAFHAAGYSVLGYDTDPNKPKFLKEGTPYLKHLGTDLYKTLAASKKFEATTDPARLGECDAIAVCVPTPLDQFHVPDLSYVVKSAETIARTVRPGQLLILESTTYPFTTRKEFRQPLEAKGLTCGKEIFIAFSPEREDPGNKSHTTVTIPKVVGGLDKPSGELSVALYAKAFKQVVPVSSAEVAESAKLLENIFRCVNIAMVNELKIVFDAMGINIWEVIEAARTKPFGFMPFYPGPGLGGHCIPIDPFYLTYKSKEFGVTSQFIELAGLINTRMPYYVVDRTARALSDRGKPLKGSRVLVLGLAYKPDIDDVRESPSFELIEEFRERGCHVDYTDPHVPKTFPTRDHCLDLTGVPCTPESIRSYDALVVSTAHAAFPWDMIAKEAKFVVDTRGAMARYAAQMGDRLFRA